MMTLWIVIAAMLLVAVVIILWPLVTFKSDARSSRQISQKQENILIFQERLAELEHEQAQDNLDAASFQQLKIELEKTLLGDVQQNEVASQKIVSGITAQVWLVMLIVTVVFVLASLATYNKLGASEKYAQFLALGDNPVREHIQPDSAAPDFSTAITLLKARLKENPGDVEKWFLLANSYAAIGDYNQSAQVYQQIATMLGEQKPGYAAAKAAYAQMMYQIAGEKMIPVVQQAINDALKVDPEEPTALILLGLKSYQEQSYPEAISAWEKAKAKAGKAQIENFIEPAIIEARRHANVPSSQQQAPQQAGAEQKPDADASAASIKINLDISPALRAQVSAQDRIFVFAKAGMPMPLAAERLQVKDLPLTIILDDSKAAMPTAKISSAEFVDITARVALSGSARATKGDLFATVKHVAVSNGVEITLRIDQIVD